MPSSVVRIGPFPDDNDCAKQLQSAIVEHFRRQEAEVAPSNSTTATHSSSLHIANKYFTATVLLRNVEEQETSSESDTHVEDGMILVFDSVLSNPKYPTSLSCSFDSLETVHDKATQQHKAGDLLRLCVGVGSRLDWTDKEYEDEYARRVLWCLDRGYEYVEADMQNLDQGHEDRDKEGFARIIEALSGTVWSTAAMNKKKQKELKQSYQADAANISGEERGAYEPPKFDAEPPSEPTAAAKATTTTVLSDQERERKAREVLLGDTEEKTVTVNDTDLLEGRRAELEEERNLNALEGSLQEARRIRELSQSGQLTDDERRQRAGEAATLIYEMMGKMGFDTDSDEEGKAEIKDEKTDNP